MLHYINKLFLRQDKRSLQAGGRKINTFLSFLALIVMVSACTDKDLLDPSASEDDYDDTPEITIGFSVKLDQIASTRADDTNSLEYWENYVNTDNLFQILFLDAEGNFLFSPAKDQYTVTSTPDKNGQYEVTIYLTSALKDKNNKSILGKIKLALEKKEGFKIAILANWRNNKNNYTLDWDWDNSYINPTALAEDKKTINDLHHLIKDEEYSKYGAYSFITDSEGKMGVSTQWVNMRSLKDPEFGSSNNESAWHLNREPEGTFSGAENAYPWVKNNWDPVEDQKFNEEGNYTHGIYRQYKKLWQLWNFGGNKDDNKVTYDIIRKTSYKDLVNSDEKFKEEWKTRNAKDFSDNWIASDGKIISDGSSIKNEYTLDGLTVVSKAPSSPLDNENYVRSYAKNGYYGLILPQMEEKVIDRSTTGKERIGVTDAREYLKFSVPGSGRLRVLYSSIKEGENATLVIQRGSTFESKYTTNKTAKQDIYNDNGKVQELDYDIASKDEEAQKFNSGYLISITGECEDIILFSLEGSCVIHAIEFVASDYLGYTDREGILPSKSHPIPMYGVQLFNPITTWGEQKEVNLSERGTQIKLIRSVAKVEVYMHIGDSPSHIYLRCMNRKSRCEPMDVNTSTSELWGDHDESVNNPCEWFAIQKHGPAFSTSAATYKSGNEWMYGTWSSWWEGIAENSVDAPHLFNPYVIRSDFCHFILDENYKDDVYHRYVLYVPDKSISDPNDIDDLSTRAKVCHIEYRKPGNSEYLDDNDCYRIYFTDYATNTAIKNVKNTEYESAYENVKENLDQHWPIMRNHIYRFYVGGGNTPQDIRVKVVDWGYNIKHAEW